MRQKGINIALGQWTVPTDIAGQVMTRTAVEQPDPGRAMEASKSARQPGRFAAQGYAFRGSQGVSLHRAMLFEQAHPFSWASPAEQFRY